MRICLISPGHLATNPRLVKEADALTQAGHAVTVVAADYLAWAREAGRSFDTRAWRIAAPVPFGPDARLSRRLRQVAHHRLGRSIFRFGLRSDRILTMACHPAAPELAATAANIDADLYVAHYTAALPAAAMAARKRRARYAFDAEDFHPGELAPNGRSALDLRLIGAIEQKWLPGCAYVTAASPGIADAYAQHYGIARPLVVLNVFPRAQAPSGPTPRGSSVPGPSIYWFSQTIGPNRGLEVAVRAISLAASRPHLYLRGHLRPNFVRELETLAQACGVGERLHLMELAPSDEMAHLAAGYDLGLSGEPGHSLNNRLALGNKLFTHLLAGLPIVASDVPAHQRIAAELGDAIRLYSAESAQSLADALDSYLMTGETLAHARATAFRLGQERFNWDLEQRVLLGCIERAAGERAPA